MANAINGDNCPECRGTGQIVLLISNVRCAACGGTGRARAAPQVVRDACYDATGRLTSVTRRGYDGEGRLLWQSTEDFPDLPGEGGRPGAAGGSGPEGGELRALVHYTYYYGPDEEQA